MKILVTGGAGFIGSAVIRHIINKTDDEVVNVDKLTYAGNLESLAEVAESSRYCFEHADICDKAAMVRIFLSINPMPSCIWRLKVMSIVRFQDRRHSLRPILSVLMCCWSPVDNIGLHYQRRKSGISFPSYFY